MKTTRLTSVSFVAVAVFLLAALPYLTTADDLPTPQSPAAPKPAVVAGKADVLRRVPKHFAKLIEVDAAKRKSKLHVEGEATAREWPINADAEIKVHGWWGRLDQFKADDRVWVWFDIDRNERPTSVLMLADEVSERDIHGTIPEDEIAPLRDKQREHLKAVWQRDGLPGSVTVLPKLGGEMDVLLDHEAMRWARYLKHDDAVTLTTETPIEAVVKDVRPWRESSSIRLVTASGLDQADLSFGQRINLRVPEPPRDVQDSNFPTDIGCIPITDKRERIEWILASIYCTCRVDRDRCTGMFYSLAGCSPTSCGNPNRTRAVIGGLINQGKSDREILE